MSSTTFVTADELLRMPEDGFRYELVRGELNQMSPAGALDSAVVGQFTGRLYVYLQQSDLGVLFGAETGFVLQVDPDTVRAPDISIVTHDRIAQAGLELAFFRGAPDLVVEVVSPRDSEEAVNERSRQWLAAGAQLVWNVWPLSRTIHVYRPDSPVEALDQSDILRGEPVLPGFECRVADIFPGDTRAARPGGC